MNPEIRYLLHGQPDKYYDRDPLYVVSQGNNKWFNFGKNLLEIDQESWRLIEPALSEAIPPTEYEKLNIKTFTIDAIIEKIRNLLNNLGAKRLNEINISDRDKEQLLIEIGQRGNNEDLWKQIPFHKTKSGYFVSIDKITFLENPNSNISSQLKPLEEESGVKIIKRSESQSLNDLQKKEISLWDSSSAMDILLQLPNSDEYSNLILYLWIWKNNGSDFKKNYQNILRETKWLQLPSGKSIAPKNVLHLPDKLAKYTRKIASLCDELYVLSDLSLSPSQLKPINQLFDNWNETDIIEFLLRQETPSDYCQIIIDTLENLDDKDEILEILRNEQWLITESGSSIAPCQVVDVSKIKVEREAQEILSQANSYYVTVEMLDSIIKNNQPILNWLKSKLFIKGTKGLEIIGDSAGELQSYSLGKFNLSEFPLEDALEVFEGIDADILPCWSLVEKIAKYNLDHCKTYIVSKILNPLESEVIINLLNWIREYKGTDETAIALYNQYLEESITANPNNFLQKIFPYILLLNLANKWASPEKLSDYKPNSTADDFYIVNETQYEILEGYLPQTINDEAIEYQDIELQNHQNQQDEYEILLNYFKDWTHVYPETIGSFLCLIMGDDLRIKELAQEYLGNISIDIVLQALIPEKELIKFSISPKSLTGHTIELNSLTRKKFQAEKKKIYLIYLN